MQYRASLELGEARAMESIREASLRGQAAGRYPFMPVRIWTLASRVAELVRKHCERGEARALMDGDFRFRGGVPHRLGAQTRMTDPDPAGLRYSA
jgi:hypothetical protein